MIPELAYIMLACARIGAVHSIIFGGFSPDSIATRINDCKSDYLITADEGVRGGKIIPLKLELLFRFGAGQWQGDLDHKGPAPDIRPEFEEFFGASGDNVEGV